MDRLLDYLNESPTIFYILKKDGGCWKLEYVTNNVVKIYGKSAEDFLKGRYFYEDFIHKVDLKKFKEEASKISKLKTNEFTYEPYRIINNRNIVWVNHTTKIIRDSNGKPCYYYGYITDITKQKELNIKLSSTTNILDSIFNNSFNFIVLLDNKGKLLKANNTSLKIINKKEEEVLGMYFWKLPWWEHYMEKELELLRDEINTVNKGICLKNHKFYYNTKGDKIYIDFSYSPVFDNEKNVCYILCEGHDITQAINTQKKLDQYVKIINDNVYISISDVDGNIINLSDAYCRLTGYSKDELIGKKHSIFKHPDSDSKIFTELWDTISRGRLWKGEHKNIKKDGTTFWVENSITPNFDEFNKIIAYTSIYNDITDKKEISQLLVTDYLTKIHNRRYFNDIFDLELRRAQRKHENFILIILDIDYFKQYNDTYGHDAGDKALIKVATKLKNTLNRANDFVFRLGGEEFGIITSKLNEPDVKELNKKILNCISDLMIENTGSEVSKYLTLSLGVVIVEPDTNLIQNEIYKLADLALYEAKRKGRNQAVIFDKN